MLDAISRAVFLSLAHSTLLKNSLSGYGMRGPHSFARRFIGGETLAEAVDTVHTLGKQGFTHTLNQLGEHVASKEAAQRATAEYLRTVEQVGLAGLPCKVSLKLSQVGIEIDDGLCADNLRSIVIAAQHHGGFVRIDMEGSGLVDRTLNIFESIWKEGHRNLGVVLQSYLYRTDDDVQRVLSLGARIRLVKGAYKEKPDVAYPDKTDVDAAFVRQARVLVSNGSAPAFATHDPRMIDAVCAFAKELGIGKDGFEFQMLYGVRRDLQRVLVGNGFSVRVYVPFGSDWFPYFMRRLAERPANVGFVLKSLMYEQKG